MTQISSRPLRFSLDRFLQQHQITAYRLEQLLKGKVARASVYSMARGDEVRRVDLGSLGEVLVALSGLVGRPVQLQELFEELKA